MQLGEKKEEEFLFSLGWILASTPHARCSLLPKANSLVFGNVREREPEEVNKRGEKSPSESCSSEKSELNPVDGERVGERGGSERVDPGREERKGQWSIRERRLSARARARARKGDAARGPRD